MGKDTKLEVRLHTQEREWLQNLGGGSLMDGLRNLIEDLKDKNAGQDDYNYYSNSKRGKWKWRD